MSERWVGEDALGAGQRPEAGCGNGASVPVPTQPLDAIVLEVVKSYRADARGHFIGRHFRPSRDEIIECIQLFLQIFFPGYFGRLDLTDEDLVYHVGGLVGSLRQKLAWQIEQCLCHVAEGEGANLRPCAGHARNLADRVLARVPVLREILIEDVQAAYDGDPAATNHDEILMAYPGMLAVAVYRVAHELHQMGVPLLPRIMTEWAHAQTGADIHPGAEIGRRFFIDHATGVVIGETTTIGNGVKLYQGVTLGALSHPRDEKGRVIRNTKRHPTVEDNVTLYAHATVLGGSTVVGAGSVVGGSVFLTRSVPPGSRVVMKAPELSVRTSNPPPGWVLDFDI
ncbi:serine O-acetyltransferase [Chondromyces crocatus]|uniref:Serine acetyltransferase n=1 Tax=Chondromyces crocatus TaxID=52 RepID=A0A0K1EEY6_CHOCO|nr:serine acetyltransferase [Chondromyces crocatus]AKT39123.1 serine acetyltransferase [Chondromyces crocatus]